MVIRALIFGVACLLIGPFMGILALFLCLLLFEAIKYGPNHLGIIIKTIPHFLLFTYLYGAVPAFGGGTFMALFLSSYKTPLKRNGFALIGCACGAGAAAIFTLFFFSYTALNTGELNTNTDILDIVPHLLFVSAQYALLGAFGGLTTAWVLWPFISQWFFTDTKQQETIAR